MKNLKRGFILILTLIIMCTLFLTSFVGCKDDTPTPPDISDNSGDDNSDNGNDDGNGQEGEDDITTGPSHSKFTFSTLLGDVMMGKFGGNIDYKDETGSVNVEFVVSPFKKDDILAGIAVTQNVQNEQDFKENVENIIFIDEYTNSYSYLKGTVSSRTTSYQNNSSVTEIYNNHIEFQKDNLIEAYAPMGTDVDKIIDEIVQWGTTDFLPLITPFATYLQEHFEANADILFNQLFIVEENADGFTLTLNMKSIKQLLLTVMNEKASDVLDTMFGKDSFKNVKSFIIDLLGKNIGTVLNQLKDNGLDVLAVVKSIDKLLVDVTGNENMTLGALIALITGQTEPIDIEAALKALENTTLGDIVKNATGLPPEADIVETLTPYIDSIGNMYLRNLILGDTSVDPSVKPEPMTEAQLEELLSDALPPAFKGTLKIIANKNRVVTGIDFKGSGKSSVDDPNDDTVSISINASDNYIPENNFLLAKTNTSDMYNKFNNIKDKLDPMYKVEYDETNKIVNIFKETKDYKMFVKMPETLEIEKIENVCGGYKAIISSAAVGYVRAPFTDVPSYYDYRMALIYNEQTGKITINDEYASSGFNSLNYDGHNYVCDESKHKTEGVGCEKKIYDFYKCSECGAEKQTITKPGHNGKKHYNVSYIDQGTVDIETICESCHKTIEKTTINASSDYMEYRYKIKNAKAAEEHGKNGYAVVRFAADGTCYAQQSYQAALTGHYNLNGVDYYGDNVYVCNNNSCDFVITHDYIYGRPETLVVNFYENGVLQDTFKYSDYVTIVNPKQ